MNKNKFLQDLVRKQGEMKTYDELVKEAGESELPSAVELCLDTPLYQEFNITIADHVSLIKLEFFDGTFDVYCAQCNQISTFKSVVKMPHIGLFQTTPAKSTAEAIEHFTTDGVFIAKTDSDGITALAKTHIKDYAHINRLFPIRLACSRNEGHTIVFIFQVENSILSKIGQFPSIASLKDYGLKKYRTILGDSVYKEFSKAVGLHSHDIGVGAFVYLRRIFETLIEDAHVMKTSTAGWDESNYQRSRMDEKIVMLKDSLPDYLVKNRSIYSILSLGIHELDEEQCLEMFDPIKVGIELILDEKIEAIEKEKKMNSVSKTINDIKSKLGK